MVKPAECLVHSTSKKQSPIVVPSVAAPTPGVEGLHQVRDGERVSPRGVGVVLLHRVGLAGGHTIGINEIKCMLFFLRKFKLNFFPSEEEKKSLRLRKKNYFRQ